MPWMAQVAPPAFLPVPGSLGLYQQGHGLTVFLNSRGEVTAYHPNGVQMWQVGQQTYWGAWEHFKACESQHILLHVVPSRQCLDALACADAVLPEEV